MEPSALEDDLNPKQVGANPTRGKVAAAACVLAGIMVATGLALKFPNLRGNAGYLALAVVTPILFGAAIGASRVVLGRRVPAAVTVALRTLLAVAVALDLAFFVAVGFIRTEAHETAPVFVTASPITASDATPASSETATATPPTTLTGHFDHRGGIDTASGDAILGVTSDGALVLRLQHFEASHGPDLHVYLSSAAAPTTPEEVMSGLEVAPLKATSGDQNYTLPAGVSLTSYKSVVIYCKSFSTIFGYATLS